MSTQITSSTTITGRSASHPPVPIQDRVSIWFALLLFGVPGVVMTVGVRWGVPLWVEQGMPLVFAWSLAIVVPTVCNALFVLTYYAWTERPTWAQFVARFRLHAPGKAIWWLTPLAAVVIVLLNDLMAWTIPLLNRLPLFAPPAIVPEIFADVYESLDQGTATFMGEALGPQSGWLIPFWLVVYVCLLVFSEEIVWRGYILPAHEAQYGRWAWVINGLLWAVLFHLYTAHTVLSDLPLYLLLPLLVSWRKNSWFGIAVHALLVSLALILVVPAVF